MNKQALIASVGAERYETAARLLRADSARADYGRGAAASPSDLPHEITDLIWATDQSSHHRIGLLFAVYDDMPAYGHLMYSVHHYPSFNASDRSYWWDQVRARVVSPDPAIRQPLLYCLWCDYFEDPDTVAEAWHAVTARPHRSGALLNAVLPVSGPVPYAMKRSLYRELLRDATFHEAIFRSIQRSVFDIYGEVDARHALRLLSRLSLPASEEMATLTAQLRAKSV